MTSIDGTNQARGVLSGAVGLWTLDPTATTITFKTRAMWGLAKVKGTFKAVGGTAQVADTGQAEGELTIDASSVDTGNSKRDNHLRSADFFESDKHPVFVFSIHDIKAEGDTRITLLGTFAVRGHSRPLDISASVFPIGADTIELHSEFQIDRSDWGVSWTKMGAKTLTELDITARFNRASDPIS